MKFLVTLLFGLICLLFIKFQKKKIICASGIFVCVWTILLSLSSLGFYGIEEPSWMVIILSIGSMFIFSLCTTVNSVKLGKKIKTHPKVVEQDSLSNNKLLYLFHLIAYIFSFPYFKKSIEVALTQGLYAVRNYAFSSSSSYASTEVLLLFQTIVQPLFVCTIIITIVDIVRKKAKLFPIVITLFDVAIYTILFAGRFMIFETIFYVVFISYDFYGGKSLLKFIKKNKKVFLGGVLGIILLVVVTSLRQDSSIFESIYVYFCGPFVYLSNLIDNGIGTNLYLLGRNQFGFIYNFIFMVLTFLFGFEYRGSDSIVTDLTGESIYFNNSTSFNSLGTMLHDFITDYGVSFCLIGVLILAVTVNIIEKKSKRSNSLFIKCLYYLAVYSTFYTIFGNMYRSPSVIVLIGFLFIFTRKFKKKKHASI